MTPFVGSGRQGACARVVAIIVATFGVWAVLLSIATARDAEAAVTQPSGEVMPQPTGIQEVSIVTSRGFPADAITLQGLFTYRAENLDPLVDAQVNPGTFSPTCGFTVEVMLRGGSCRMAFGWYNATPGGTTPPTASEIYPLVSPDAFVGTLKCADADFCPLATAQTTQAPQHSWMAIPFSSGDLRDDTRYRNGQIGFALVGDPSGRCTQTKFSQSELNTKSAAGAAWVTTLVYKSTATPNAYYLAFEDLPMSTTSWKGTVGDAGVVNSPNDGDFNDLVFLVSFNGAGTPNCADTRPDAGVGAGGGAGTGGRAGTGGTPGSGGVVGGGGGGSGSGGTTAVGTGGVSGGSGGAGPATGSGGAGVSDGGVVVDAASDGGGASAGTGGAGTGVGRKTVNPPCGCDAGGADIGVVWPWLGSLIAILFARRRSPRDGTFTVRR